VVNKVRLVAASQLDALDRLCSDSNGHDAVQAQKLQSAQNHLCKWCIDMTLMIVEFLGILGDIESLYSFTGEICMEV